MPDVTSTLCEILADHGVETNAEPDGWLSTNGSYPACRAIAEDPKFLNGGCKLRMDVEFALSEDRLIIESFSDFGADPTQAFRSSLQNFCTGTLHVLLSALWGVVDDSQVFIEPYTINGTAWTLHLGNIVRKAADGADVPPPADLMSIFDSTVSSLKLDSGVHWGRLFYANMPNMNNIVEVLIDNHPSHMLQEKFRAASWAKTSYFYSHRMFWVFTRNRLA
jgi:hypothetical protein